MKRILLGTALAGMLVGTFSSLSLAAPLPARPVKADSAVINVAEGCGPYAHRDRFRDRFGRLVWGRCVPNHRERFRDYDYDYRYYR
jgi:hypothetical protein